MEQEVFDVDEYLEALKAPIFRIGGREYRGRIVSLDEWLPVWQEFGGLDEPGTQGLVAFRDALIRYCDVIFPRPRWHHLVPWRPKWVGERLMRFPPGLMMEAIKDLFRSQGFGMRLQAADAGHAEPLSDTSSPDSSATTEPTPTEDPGPHGTE